MSPPNDSTLTTNKGVEDAAVGRSRPADRGTGLTAALGEGLMQRLEKATYCMDKGLHLELQQLYRRSSLPEARRAYEDDLEQLSDFILRRLTHAVGELERVLGRRVDEQRSSYADDRRLDDLARWLALWAPFAILQMPILFEDRSARISADHDGDRPARQPRPPKVLGVNWKRVALHRAGVGNSASLRSRCLKRHPVFSVFSDTAKWPELKRDLELEPAARRKALREVHLKQAFDALEAARARLRRYTGKGAGEENWSYLKYFVEGVMRDIFPELGTEMRIWPLGQVSAGRAARIRAVLHRALGPRMRLTFSEAVDTATAALGMLAFALLLAAAPEALLTALGAVELALNVVAIVGKSITNEERELLQHIASIDEHCTFGPPPAGIVWDVVAVFTGVCQLVGKAGRGIRGRKRPRSRELKLGRRPPANERVRRTGSPELDGPEPGPSRAVGGSGMGEAAPPSTQPLAARVPAATSPGGTTAPLVRRLEELNATLTELQSDLAQRKALAKRLHEHVGPAYARRGKPRIRELHARLKPLREATDEEIHQLKQEIRKIRAEMRETHAELRQRIHAELGSEPQVLINRRTGEEYEFYVEETKLRGVTYEAKPTLPTPEPDVVRNYVQPDWAIYDRHGHLTALADAKSGSHIPFDAQARGFIRWAATTRSKKLLYFTPSRTTTIDRKILEFAAKPQYGVEVRVIFTP